MGIKVYIVIYLCFVTRIDFEFRTDDVWYFMVLFLLISIFACIVCVSMECLLFSAAPNVILFSSRFKGWIKSKI